MGKMGVFSVKSPEKRTKKLTISAENVAGRKKVPTKHSPTGSQGADAIKWVADQLDSVSEPKRTDAPTAAAWSLYQWAKDEPSKFWTQLYKGAVTKEKPEENRSITDDQRKFFRIFDILEAERPELITNDAFPRRSAVQVVPEPVPLTQPIGPESVPLVPTVGRADPNGQIEV